MYLPRPNFTNNATPAEIRRYLVMLVEELEKEIKKLEDAINGEDV